MFPFITTNLPAIFCYKKHVYVPQVKVNNSYIFLNAVSDSIQEVKVLQLKNNDINIIH